MKKSTTTTNNNDNNNNEEGEADNSQQQQQQQKKDDFFSITTRKSSSSSSSSKSSSSKSSSSTSTAAASSIRRKVVATVVSQKNDPTNNTNNNNNKTTTTTTTTSDDYIHLYGSTPKQQQQDDEDFYYDEYYYYFDDHEKGSRSKSAVVDENNNIDSTLWSELPTGYSRYEYNPNYKYQNPYIRGVNIGGWLVIERYIVPYLFAITDCHLIGDLCWYPGQLGAPSINDPVYKTCNLYKCKPYRKMGALGYVDYPMDEYTLSQAFIDYMNPTKNQTAGRMIAERWMNYHFQNFVTRDDLVLVKQSGVTHIRVPLPHWILGDVEYNEPWIVGDRWNCFIRLLDWCRELNIQVWPDIHTAPGSQNGFDNSGRAGTVTCTGWSNSPYNVQRSLNAIESITAAIRDANYTDVVTGFGLLNEPFQDCDRDVYEHFIDIGRDIARNNLGNNTAVYVSDMFMAATFNSKKHQNWWQDGSIPENVNTFLDSHYYHVFAEQPRSLSPRQHIAFVCQNEYHDVLSCCYKDAPNRNIPSTGIQRLIGEWSAAYDILPVAMLRTVMDGIAAAGSTSNDHNTASSSSSTSSHTNGTAENTSSSIAPYFDRQLSVGRQEFLKRFIEAQMVAYEAAETGLSGGWFYWTLKMEGGAFAEWDYIRGYKEGWIQKVPDPTIPIQNIYGSCYDIIFKTVDDMNVIHEYPDPTLLPSNNWQGVIIDDDVVVTHGTSLFEGGGEYPYDTIHIEHNNHHKYKHHGQYIILLVLVLIITMGAVIYYCYNIVRPNNKHNNNNNEKRKAQYTVIKDITDTNMIMERNDSSSCTTNGSSSGNGYYATTTNGTTGTVGGKSLIV